jgi:hypothetical protein
MARVRTVKPEFWTDRRVGECSPSARLLFIAAWNFADDEGGLDRSAKQLKAQAFPYDNLDCEPLVQELLNAGLLIEYQVGGEKYLHIKNFRKHQRIDKPQKARIPIYEPAKSVPGTFVECSGNIHGSKGMEGNLREGERETRASEHEFATLKAAYPEGTYRQSEWLLAEREVERRLTEGHGWQDLHAGTDRYAKQCQAKGNIGTQFVLSPAKFFAGDPQPKFLEPYPLPAARAGPARKTFRDAPTTEELEAREAANAGH